MQRNRRRAALSDLLQGSWSLVRSWHDSVHPAGNYLQAYPNPKRYTYLRLPISMGIASPTAGYRSCSRSMRPQPLAYLPVLRRRLVVAHARRQKDMGITTTMPMH